MPKTPIHQNPIHRGGCHCGAIRFETVGALDKVIACHCRDCLKTVGNSMAATAVLAKNIAITGDTLKWYRSSATAERGFCTNCGALLFYRGDGRPTISISAGMLDDPSVLEFDGHIYLHDHPGHQPLEAEPNDLHEQFASAGRKME